MILQVAIFVSHLLCCSIAQESLHESVVSNPQNARKMKSNSHVFMESIPHLNRRSDIQKIDRMTSDFIHEVTFVIKQRNMRELTIFLDDVSDPASVNYGKHMTKEEVANLTSNPTARDATMSYLTSSGATIVEETLNGEYVTANASISVWERMLNTRFFMFHLSENNNIIKKVVRAESYSIPIGLQLYVDGTFNTIQMPPQYFGNYGTLIPEEVETEEMTLTATSSMTPATLKRFYNVGNAQGSASSTQAIFAAIEQYFSPADLFSFLRDAGLPQQKVVKVVGGHSSDSVCVKNPESCAEANLDVQYIMAASTASPTTFWYTDQSWSGWLRSVANTPKPPLVFSISYGQEESFVSRAEKDAFSREAIKLGAMGVTIVAASGDDGAISRAVRIDGVSACSYVAIFPASNPYVTAVGATSVSAVKFTLHDIVQHFFVASFHSESSCDKFKLLCGCRILLIDV